MKCENCKDAATHVRDNIQLCFSCGWTLSAYYNAKAQMEGAQKQVKKILALLEKNPR